MTEMTPNEEGRLAFEGGFMLSDCPYPDDSEEAVEWEGAWMEAEEEAADE